MVCESNSNKNIIAYIKINNFASKKIFEKNNFKIVDSTTIDNKQYILKMAK